MPFVIIHDVKEREYVVNTAQIICAAESSDKVSGNIIIQLPGLMIQSELTMSEFLAIVEE